MLYLIFFVITITNAQNLYGPSQLEQYGRLINSGNLNGFGWLNQAIQKGIIRGFGDIDERPRLQGLPPLPLTHEEVMYQLTSTHSPPTTIATARPTAPTTTSQPQNKMFGVDPTPELPPIPEERLHGTYDNDGVFHPFIAEVNAHPRRSQIRGTKIRDFSDPDRQNPSSETLVAEDYEAEEFYDDPTLRIPKESHRLTQHEGNNQRRAFQVDQDAHSKPTRNFKGLPTKRVVTPKPITPELQKHTQFSTQIQPKAQPPAFAFHPRPPPVERESVLNNLLSEVEEYDDFLDQQRSYHEKYPNVPVVNPYRMLPEGQLPTINSRTNFVSVPSPQQALLLPRADVTSPTLSSTVPQQQIWTGKNQFHSTQIPNKMNTLHQSNNGFSSQVHRGGQESFQFSREATEHPLLSIFNLFSLPHAHALAAPSVQASSRSGITEVNMKDQSTIEGTSIEKGSLLPANVLVDIHQKPLGVPATFTPLG